MINDKKRDYFRTSGTEVVKWWTPAESHAARQYDRGNRIVETLSLELPTDARVLDAACGKGRASALLASRCRIIALDIAPEMLAAFDQGTAQTCWRVVGDVACLPFPDRSFDAIVCLEALVHLDSPTSAFAEFWRVLKPGGFLLVSFDNKWGLLRVIKVVINQVVALFDRDFRLERKRRGSIFTPQTLYETRVRLNSCGFHLERCMFIGVIMPFAIGERIIFGRRTYDIVSSFIEWIDHIPGLRRLATYIYVVGRRPVASTEHSPLVDDPSGSTMDVQPPSRLTQNRRARIGRASHR